MNHVELPQSGSPQPEKVKSMFAKVAGQYDKANSVLSLGIHHLWRKQVVQWSGAQAGQKVLDCATGTGDLAIEFKKAVGPTGQVRGTDFCPEMLSTAPLKAQSKKLDIHFEIADVTQLQYPPGSFDITSISFGIRNVYDPVVALKEMARVTRPGGTVIVLEFGQMSIPVLNSLYNFYSKNILPKIGGYVTGEPGAYTYLQESSAQFPSGDDFLKLMKKSDAFQNYEYRALSFGIAYMYKGTVR